MINSVEISMSKKKYKKSNVMSSCNISVETKEENDINASTSAKKKNKKLTEQKEYKSEQSNDHLPCHTGEESLTEAIKSKICTPVVSDDEVVTEEQISRKKKKRKHHDGLDGKNDESATCPAKKKRKKDESDICPAGTCLAESTSEESSISNVVAEDVLCQTVVSPKRKKNKSKRKALQEEVDQQTEIELEQPQGVAAAEETTEDDDGAVEHVSKEAEIAALDLKVDSNLSFDILANRSFESLRGMVSAATMSGLQSFGFSTMTDIQALALPPLLEGKDLRGTAKTGSGKTLAFVIPAVELLHKLNFEPCHGTGVIILCPTRELSMQTYSVVQLMADHHRLTHGLIIGGANRKAEATNLKKGINILVGTPGRMLDHLKNTKGFQYGNLVCFILDEADRMLSIGFEDEMKVILKIIPKRRQTMLFSATRTPKTDSLTTLALKVTLVDIDVDADKNTATVDQLTQSYLVCPTEQRFLILYTFLKRKKNKKIMVFFSSCDAVRFYHDLLNYIDVPVQCIHGKQKQAKRTESFYSFNAATAATLLCTDVAARGWDIPAVDWIIQYDPPEDPSEYIHRVGRTARGGREGQALLMLREEELPFVRYLKERKVMLNPIEVQQGKILNIQKQLEKLINKNYFLASSGRQAFKSYLYSYMKHRHKEFFDVHRLDQSKAAKSFGFDRPPVIDLTLNYDKRNKNYKEKRVKFRGQ